MKEEKKKRKGYVLPACAGVILNLKTMKIGIFGFTRMRGGDPLLYIFPL